MVSDMVDDQIDTVGKAFLGLTLGCARCHDHKFDPVSQHDYYALAGIFYSTHILKDLGTKGGEITLQPRAARPARPWSRPGDEAAAGSIDGDQGEADARSTRSRPSRRTIDPERAALITRARPAAEAELPPSRRWRWPCRKAACPADCFPKIQDVPIHIRGSYTRLARSCRGGMPAFFAGDSQPTIREGSGRRELADWVASKDNPLTARVIVNRVWQWHFGDGLVPHAEQLRHALRTAVAPGAARLAGRPVRRGRLVAEEAAPPDHALGHVPAVERRGPRPDSPAIRRTAGSGDSPRGDWKPRRFAMPCSFVTGRLDRTPGGPADRRPRLAAPLALRADGPLGPQQLRDAVRRRQPGRLRREADRQHGRPAGALPAQPRLRAARRHSSWPNGSPREAPERRRRPHPAGLPAAVRPTGTGRKR